MSSLRSLVVLVAASFAQLTGALVAGGAIADWQLTNPVRFSSDPLILRLATPEMVLVIGVLAYVLASAPVVAVLESRLTAASRRSRAAAFGLLPLLGVATYFLCSTEPRGMPDTGARERGQTVPAAIAIGLAGLTVIGGVVFISQARKPSARLPTISADVANRRAYAALKEIIAAQSEYIKEDWDGDGQHQYALFVVHLWRTARRNKPPVEVGLLPEELAVASVAGFARDGFVFRNLHQRAVAGSASTGSSAPGASVRELDYAKEWALIAEPATGLNADDEHYLLQLIALSDGGILARRRSHADVKLVPLDLHEAWSPVTSLADIERLQSKAAE